MALRSLATFITLAFFSINARTATPTSSGGRIKISSTRVATATIDDTDYDIFPETQNLDNPKAANVWRFDVQPMFVLKRSNAGDGIGSQPIDMIQTHYETRKIIVPGGYQYDVRTRLILTLIVKTKEQMDKAVEALNALYKPEGLTFSNSQVSTIPVTHIDLDFSDLKGDKCKLQNESIDIIVSEPEVRLYFDCLDHYSKDPGGEQQATKKVAHHDPQPTNETDVLPPSVEAFKKRLPYMIATIRVTYDAKEAERASVNVQAVDVKKSKFYADLAGKGDSVYVSRNDLRNLGIEASKDLSYMIQGRKMTADELATCTTPQMMSFPENSLEWSQVTAETLSRTYNSKDLDPTEVDKELSEIVNKSSSEDDVQINTGAKASGLWGLGEAEGHLDGHTFQKRAEEHGVKVEWDGKKWVAKGLDVHLVNLNELTEKISRSCVFETYGDGTQLTIQSRQLRMN